jgi:hypothetical protein
MWGGRLEFCAVLLILLVASPFTAPFRACGKALIPETARPAANDADGVSLIGSPVERAVRRVMPLAPLPAFDVPCVARSSAVDAPPIAARDSLHAFQHSTILRI